MLTYATEDNEGSGLEGGVILECKALSQSRPAVQPVAVRYTLLDNEKEKVVQF